MGSCIHRGMKFRNPRNELGENLLFPSASPHPWFIPSVFRTAGTIMTDGNWRHCLHVRGLWVHKAEQYQVSSGCYLVFW